MYSETLLGPPLGPKKFGPNNEVALIMRLESTPELYLRPTRGGHYNKVVLLQRWPLSEISLYTHSEVTLYKSLLLLRVTCVFLLTTCKQYLYPGNDTVVTS